MKYENVWKYVCRKMYERMERREDGEVNKMKDG